MLSILHRKSYTLSNAQWQAIRAINQKIIPQSLYDQRLVNGGCLESTCESAIQKAREIGSADVLLGFEEERLVSYMIFYCLDNPPMLENRLRAYSHLGQVGYSDMLVVDPLFQQRGYAQQMRSQMKFIAQKAGVSVFMTFVRAIPIPNLPSLKSLQKAGALFTNNTLTLQRQLPGIDQPITDICYELIYPADDRCLSMDKCGKINWV